VSCENTRRITGVPVVVVDPVVVPVPGTVLIPIKVEDIAVAIRVPHQLYKMPSMPPPLDPSTVLRVIPSLPRDDCSWDCIVFGI